MLSFFCANIQDVGYEELINVEVDVDHEEPVTADEFEKEWNKHYDAIQELLIALQKQISDEKDPERINLKGSIRPLTDQLDEIDKKIYKKIKEKLLTPSETIFGFSRENFIKYACHGLATVSCVQGTLISFLDNATEDTCEPKNNWNVGFFMCGAIIEIGYNLLQSIEGSEEKERQKLKNICIQTEN